METLKTHRKISVGTLWIENDSPQGYDAIIANLNKQCERRHIVNNIDRKESEMTAMMLDAAQELGLYVAVSQDETRYIFCRPLLAATADAVAAKEGN